MCNYVRADKAHLASSAERNLHIQKCNTRRDMRSLLILVNPYPIVQYIDLTGISDRDTAVTVYSITVPITGRESVHGARATRARVSVNFCKFSPCIARAARAGLTFYPPSRTFELLAFDEYCRFDTSAFFSV